MGDLTMAGALACLAHEGKISAKDVLTMRTAIFADGAISRDEAEQLVALNAENPDQCPEWQAFFCEAIIGHIVHQQKPAGYVSDDVAAWLIGAVSRDGVVGSALEMELVVSVLEEAKSSPAALSAFALEQVALAVVNGEGPLVAVNGNAPGLIGRPAVELLRRILYAFSGDGNIAVTRPEAEVLFHINDGVSEELSDPSWSELFVKAVANFVLASSGYEVPSRAEVLRHDTFFERADANIGGFFARMAAGGVAGILEAYAAPDDTLEAAFGQRNRADEAKARQAVAVNGEEARWLTERMTRERLLRENERALLRFIRQAASAIHPDLKPLLDKAG